MPVWIEALNTKTNQDQIRIIEHSTACSIVRCQRTAKREAVLYLSGINPIQLMAKERCQTFEEHHLTKQEQQAKK